MKYVLLITAAALAMSCSDGAMFSLGGDQSSDKAEMKESDDMMSEDSADAATAEKQSEAEAEASALNLTGDLEVARDRGVYVDGYQSLIDPLGNGPVYYRAETADECEDLSKRILVENPGSELMQTCAPVADSMPKEEVAQGASDEDSVIDLNTFSPNANPGGDRMIYMLDGTVVMFNDSRV